MRTIPEIIYSVSKINDYIERMFDNDAFFRLVNVEGEVISFNLNKKTGHYFFTLKEGDTTLAGIVYKSKISGLRIIPTVGMKVVATGSIGCYKPNGIYQIRARQFREVGVGDEKAKLEELRNKLLERGVFSELYKKPIPRYVRTVGIVTAPDGAAVNDIISVAKGDENREPRNPFVQLIVYPSLVQGPNAPENIVRGIKILDRYGVDVIIVGRGGGDNENLSAFNDERVAMAVFEAHTPIISAVGHSIDHTLTDDAADLFVVTPTEAAVRAIYDVWKVLENIEQYRKHLMREMELKLKQCKMRGAHCEALLKRMSPALRLAKYREMFRRYEQQLARYAPEIRLQQYRERYAALKAKLERYSPEGRLPYYRERLCRYQERLQALSPEIRLQERKRRLPELEQLLAERMERILQARKQQLKLYAQTMTLRSPLERLSGGYAYATDENGKAILSVETVQTGDQLHLQLRDGRIDAVAERIEKQDKEQRM